MSWLGKIRLPSGKHAVLQGNGEWQCEDIDVQQYLNVFFAVADHFALGLPAGRAVVSKAAASLDGIPEFSTKLVPLHQGELS